jgi:Flp pilus assembly protein TadG
MQLGLLKIGHKVIAGVARRPAERACLRTTIGSFAAARGGVTAVEFALVMPIFILLIVETLQLGLYFYTSASLDYATNAAARQIMIGAVGQQTPTAFRTDMLCAALPAAMPCASVITNIVNVPEAVSPHGFYTYVNAPRTALVPPPMDNTKTSFCPGLAGSYVYMQVYYAMPLISPIWRAAASVTWSGKAVHFVSAAAVFKNEPFQSQQNGC